jgi:hypothetical protein
MTQFRAIENALFAERRLRIENAQALDDKAETARDLSSRLSNKQANEAERVKELRAAVGRERERRLDETRSVAEQRVLVQELQSKLSSCQVEQRSELQRSESLATKLEQQAGELERCDNKAEDLFLCKQSSAVKDRELIESTERLRLCKKHLDAATSSAEPLELGMR